MPRIKINNPIVTITMEKTDSPTSFEKNKRQVNLSVRRMVEKQERERVSDFISSQGESAAKLGDILGEKLKTLDN